MRITVNLYYTGTNGNARKFAEEMTSSGVVVAVREEEGNGIIFKKQQRKGKFEI